MTAPRGLSQPPTSFIGSQCQGIHHAPLNTYNTKQTKKNEKKESHYNKPHQPTPQRVPATSCGLMLATTIHKSNTTPHHQVRRQHEPPHTHPQKGDHPEAGTPTPRRGGRRGPVVSGPNSVSGDTRSTHPQRSRPRPGQRLVHRAPEPDPLQTRAHPTNPFGKTGNPALCGPARTSWCSLERR